jgi:hypothetical protein
LRMLGIVATMRLLVFINVASPRIEFWLEAVLQAAAFIGLAMPMFRLSPRNAAILGFMSFMALIALVISAWAIQWW